MAPPAGRGAGKDPNALRTIREVSEELGVAQHVLRFWETRFPDLKPMKRGGNRRYYRPQDVDFAAALQKLLHFDGYTVKGVQKLIAEHGARKLPQIAAAGTPLSPPVESAPVRTGSGNGGAGARAAAAPDTDALLAELKRLRAALAAALRS